MNITQSSETRIGELDNENIVFGVLYTDHMAICDFKNGQWQTPEIIPFANWSMPPGAAVFHYGQAIFEGLKCYRDDNEDIWLFRPKDNEKRFNISAHRMHMPELPDGLFLKLIVELLKLDSQWVPRGLGKSLYIRPFMVATHNRLKAASAEEFRFSVICSPVGPYYGKPLKVKIAQKFSRAASGGVGYAKAAGNYAASFYPMDIALKEGFDQVIWTDSSTHSEIEEAGTMNIFFRIKDRLITVPIGETILDGITRKSIIELVESNGIKVEIKPVTLDDLMQTHREGNLLEAFGCGTAAAVSPIKSFDLNGTLYELPKLKDEDQYGTKIKKQLLDIQYNIALDPFGWRMKVE